MVATGCTYGRSNIEKPYYNKMVFTLNDVNNMRVVRVTLKPKFFHVCCNLILSSNANTEFHWP